MHVQSCCFDHSNYCFFEVDVVVVFVVTQAPYYPAELVLPQKPVWQRLWGNSRMHEKRLEKAFSLTFPT